MISPPNIQALVGENADHLADDYKHEIQALFFALRKVYGQMAYLHDMGIDVVKHRELLRL